MAKFCSEECKDNNSICDFCVHYQDEYRDILKLTREDGSFKFAGEGVCEADNSEVMACDGFNCDNFECFMIKDDNYIEVSNKEVKEALNKCNDKYKEAMQKLADSDLKLNDILPFGEIEREYFSIEEIDKAFNQAIKENNNKKNEGD